MRTAFNALILRSGNYSGVHVAAINSAMALAASATPQNPLTIYCNKSFELPVIDNEAVNIRKLLMPMPGRAGRILYELLFMNRRLHQDNIDLLHCPAYLAPRTGIPVVLNIHDIFALRYPALCKKLNSAHYKKRMPQSIAKAAAIITPCKHVREEMVIWNSSRKESDPDIYNKIHPVPWGVEDFFRPCSSEQQAEAIRKYSLPEKFIFFAGRAEPKKNTRQLVEAFFAANASSGVDCKLVVAGPKGWKTADPLRFAAQLGITEKVINIGFVERRDMPMIYSAAQMLLFPSLAEGFGLPVLEAMSCGCPVACCDIPSIKEVAADAALYAKPGNLQQLRETIETFLTDQKKRAEFSEKGITRSRAFSWENHARQVRQIYSQIWQDCKKEKQ